MCTLNANQPLLMAWEQTKKLHYCVHILLNRKKSFQENEKIQAIQESSNNLKIFSSVMAKNIYLAYDASELDQKPHH